MTLAIGMNVGSISYWTPCPFLNRFKTADPWQIAQVPLAASLLDADGYPLSVTAGAPSPGALFGPFPEGDTSTYRLRYDGTGTVTVGAAAKAITSKPGELLFNAMGPTCYVIIKASDPKDHVRNISVVRSDECALFDAGEIFSAAYIDRFGMFEAFRFMDWANINKSLLVSWPTRSKPSDWSWSTVRADGVPLEVQIERCNRTGADMWLNIPTLADDTYVRNALTLVRDKLRKDLKVEVEYSNEVWNWGFKASHLALTAGDNLLGVDVNKDGKVDPGDAKEHVGDGWMQYYGYRSAQIAAIGHEVFAATPGRVSHVVSTQTYNIGLNAAIIKGAIKANVGAPGKLLQALAITTYFAGQFVTSNATDRAIVLGWAKGGAAGMDAAFKEMEFGGALSFKNALADLPAIYASHKAFADNYGMKLVAYEGGLSIDASGYTGADQATMVDFMRRLVSDPRMGSLYARMIADFSASGGERLMHLTDVSPVTAKGAWGSLENINQLHSPRYDALVAAATTKPVPPVAPKPVLADLLADIDALRARVIKAMT